MMQNCRVIATLGVGLLFSLLAPLAVMGQTSQSSSQGEAKSSEFVLPQKHESRLTPAERRGQALYEYYCYLCHGRTGKADGFNSYSLATPPVKLADAAFMTTLSDAQVKTVIKGGGPALGLPPQMPTWGGVLTDKQIDDVLSFIRTLSKKTE